MTAHSSEKFWEADAIINETVKLQIKDKYKL